MQSVQALQRFVSSRVLATRQGTIMLGVGAAVLAGLVLLVYLNRYRESVGASTAPVKVLLANRLIEKGELGDTVAVSRSYELGDVPKDHVKEGALVDPAALRGTVATQDLLPGQQITRADFAYAANVGGVGSGLQKKERAIAVPVDNPHGLVGRVQPGDHVDVYAALDVNGQAVVKIMLQDILVLEPAYGAGGGIGNNGSSTMLVRVTSGQAAKLAFATENGKVWFVLRPRGGAKPVKPATITVNSIVGG